MTLHVVALALALVNGIALSCVVGYGFQVMKEVRNQGRQMEPVLSVIEQNRDSSTVSAAAANAAITVLNDQIRDGLSDFILGSPNGTIGAFVENFLRSDFRGLAQKVESLASKVENSFFSGCSEQWCMDAFARAGSFTSIVRSVSKIVANNAAWPSLQNATNPAMSNGLFRLNELNTWFSSQTYSSSWSNAGVLCLSFVDAVDNVYWSGNYRNSVTPGDINHWDAEHKVSEIARDVRDVCSMLRGI